MNLIDILGLIAGACTTVAFIPQVVKTFKSKSAKDLSLGMFFTFWLGVIMWLIYGFIKTDLPIIVANAMTLLLATFLLFLKFKYRKS